MFKVNNRNTRRRCDMFKVNNNNSRVMTLSCSGVESVVTRVCSKYLPVQGNDIDTRIRCEICSELTMKKPERIQKYFPDDVVVGFEHTSYLVLVFLLLIFSIYFFAGLDKYNKA